MASDRVVVDPSSDLHFLLCGIAAFAVQCDYDAA